MALQRQAFGLVDVDGDVPAAFLGGHVFGAVAQGVFNVHHGLHGQAFDAGAGGGVGAELGAAAALREQAGRNDQHAADDVGVTRDHLAHGLQLGAALLQAGAELFGAAAGVFGLQPGLLAGPHVQVELDGAIGPVLDLLDQAFAHGGELAVGLALAAAGNLLRVLGHQAFHGVGQRARFDLLRDPVGAQDVSHQDALLGGDGHQVKVAGVGRGRGSAVGGHFDKLQAAGDVAGGVARGGARLGCGLAHAVVEHEQHAGLGAVVVRIDQHRAALEQPAMAGQHQICDGGHQRMAGVHQVGGGLAVERAAVAVKTDAFVLAQQGGARVADDTVALDQVGRDVAHLVAAGFAVAQFAAQYPEGFAEESADEVGLELARLGLVHVFADGVEVVEAHVVFDQGVARHQRLEVAGVKGVVDDPLHAGARFGQVAVADGADQQVFERHIVKGLAEHVEHPAPEGLAHGVELFEQAGENFALPGLGGDQIPEVADLALTDAVDAAEALFDAVGVPRQVVIDHEVGVLQVDALPGRVGGQQHQHIGVVAEFFLDLAPVVAVGAAVDGDHRSVAAQRVADAQQQVVEGVAVLGEDDQLAAATLGGEHFGLVLQQAGELLPFAIAA